MIEIADLSITCLSHPSFELIDFEHFLRENDLEWVRDGKATNSELLVEAAGRLCYMSFGKNRQSPRNTQQYILNLIDQGHESVLEHLNWTFLLTGVSRAFTHQLVRHRVGFSFSQLSQQYHDESDTKFVAPLEVKLDSNLFKDWSNHIEKSLNFYKSSIKKIEYNNTFSNPKEKMRALRSASRSILPNATETKIVITVNARALRHFFDMRGAIEGDYEMRKVSEALYNIVCRDAPALFQDFEKIDGDTHSVQISKKKISKF